MLKARCYVIPIIRPVLNTKSSATMSADVKPSIVESQKPMEESSSPCMRKNISYKVVIRL